LSVTAEGLDARAGSYYRLTATPYAAMPALLGAREAEVCVIGAGFAGLNIALGLAERGVRDVVLIEAAQIGHGASGRNGGFAFGGFSRGEEQLLRELGPEKARRLYHGTLQAVELIRARCHHYAIACDVNAAGVLWTNWFRDPEVLRSRQRLLAEHFDVRWDWLSEHDLRDLIHSERYHGALRERHALHLHPLNYAIGLAKAALDHGVSVHERTPAIDLVHRGQEWEVRTPGGSIRTRQVVLACGGYLAGLRQAVDSAVLPIATYVMATEPLGDRLRELMTTQAAVYDTRFAFDYYRPLPDTRLLWGGRISVFDRPPGAVEKLLRSDLERVFPQLTGVRVDYAWSGLMSYARHQMPQLGEIEPGLWLAQAFGGHGVAPTTFAGELLAAAIAEGDAQWRDFADYPLVSALKPAGFVAAQLNYWWLQAKDAWKDWRERLAA
jgi:gamma-glutamylputrescine oxidase